MEDDRPGEPPGDAASELKWLDRALQRWRIRKAGRFIAAGERVLDVGCADGALFAQLDWISSGLGIDPEASDATVRDIKMHRGHFPDDLPPLERFDVITALAVFEHVPPQSQTSFVEACRSALTADGRVVLTIPAPLVDHLIAVLQRLRVLRGMEAEQHWGFRPAATDALFTSHGFALVLHRRFQLGLNHLFVYKAI